MALLLSSPLFFFVSLIFYLFESILDFFIFYSFFFVNPRCILKQIFYFVESIIPFMIFSSPPLFFSYVFANPR
ncbi:hypothetical protein ZOSMA_2G01180 [Zostera marina]|uniref:Uncharacterized protein n=1 Tax=Zostera marina TaxID=29655 RepID=A0A0K9PD37_ZOSMR|nr:hypothetical protein ZOSMA_2G01180 [Zostera marina]